MLSSIIGMKPINLDMAEDSVVSCRAYLFGDHMLISNKTIRADA